MEALEQPRLLLLWDALPVVAHGHHGIATAPLERHHDLGVGSAVLHRVRQEVAEDLLDARRIGEHAGRLSSGLEAHGPAAQELL